MIVAIHSSVSPVLVMCVGLGSLASCHGQAPPERTVSAPSASVLAFFQSNSDFFRSNLVSFFALERTNPALAKDVIEKNRLKERLLEINAHRTITYLQDFGWVFPTNIDYWHYSWQAAGQRVWSIQTGLYGRCLLQMNVAFEVDSTLTNIASYTPPSLRLITYADPAPGRKDFCTGYDELSRSNFMASDWTNLVRLGGDLSALGFTGPTNRPLLNFDSQWRMQKW